MLRMDTWVQSVPDEPTKVATLPGHFFRHAGQDAASLSRLVKEHCVDYRSLYRTTAWASDVRRTRGEVERLFVLVVFGDLIGLPVLPPYYTLRLLPYVVPTLERWKRALLRERDWTDLTELIEGID